MEIENLRDELDAEREKIDSLEKLSNVFHNFSEMFRNIPPEVMEKAIEEAKKHPEVSIKFPP